ncbi:hypothetical protein BKA81DRAFT_368769 [Phyllosticta paracitricarpa]
MYCTVHTCSKTFLALLSLSLLSRPSKLLCRSVIHRHRQQKAGRNGEERNILHFNQAGRLSARDGDATPADRRLDSPK